MARRRVHARLRQGRRVGRGARRERDRPARHRPRLRLQRQLLAGSRRAHQRALRPGPRQHRPRRRPAALRARRGDLGTGWGPDHVDANNQIIEATLGLRYMFGGAARRVGRRAGRRAVADRTSTASSTTSTPARTRPRTRTASRTPTAARIPTTTATACSTPPTSARTSPRTRTASRTPTAARIPTTTATACSTPPTSARTRPKGVKVDATGCPIAQEIKAALVLEGVNFKTNSAEIEPERPSVLDRSPRASWPGRTSRSRSAATRTARATAREEPDPVAGPRGLGPPVPDQQGRGGGAASRPRVTARTSRSRTTRPRTARPRIVAWSSPGRTSPRRRPCIAGRGWIHSRPASIFRPCRRRLPSASASWPASGGP